MIDTVRSTQRNVKHWLRGNRTAVDRLRDARSRKQYRKVIGYLDLPRLAVAMSDGSPFPGPRPPPTATIGVTV